MDVEREKLVKFGVPILITAVFVALIAVAGSIFAAPPGSADGGNPGVQLSETGGFVLVGLIVLFVLTMAVGGSLIGRRQADDE